MHHRLNANRCTDVAFVNFKKSSVCALALLAAFVTPLYAQEAGSNDQSAESVLEEIRVTGTRIRRTGMTTPTPVTAVESEELNRMAPDSMISGLTQLPQFDNSQTPNAAAGESWFTRGGYGNLNMRGLGINRTLTLLDSRRVISSTVFGGVDINTFPEAMISRVETVTGGASAAYGTDAVAGVVNFILDTDFTGLDLNVQGGITSRGDAENYKASAAWGTDIGERGHIQLSIEQFHREGVHGYDGRDWYRAWGTIPDADGMLLRRPNVISNAASYDGIIFAPGAPFNGAQFHPDGSYTPLDRGSRSAFPVGIPPARSVGGSADDLGADFQTLYPDLTRRSFFAYADYDVTSDLTVFAQYIHGEVSTFRYNPAPISLQGTPTQVTIFQDNAYLPDSLRQAMIDNGVDSFILKRQGGPQDLGRGTLRDDSNMDSITAGFDYTLDTDGFLDDWAVNGYYQYGHNSRKGRQVGLRVDRLFAAVDAVRDPATGEVVCRASLFGEAFPGCQPLNLFGRGNASPAAVDYVIGNDVGEEITTPLYFAGSGFSPERTISYTAEEAKVNITTLDQHVAEFAASGTLFDGWAGPISGAFGASYRRDHVLQMVHDSTNQSSNHDDGHPVLCDGEAPGLRGVNPPDCANTVGIQYSKVSNIVGTINVKEAFAETQIPLANDWGIVESAAANVAGRWADYSGSGSVWAYKGGLDVQFDGGLRLRGTYSRDVRAANLSERFDQTGGIAVLTDPRYPDDGEVNVTIFSGGNPNVDPEKADTFTAGLVYQPPFLPGLSTSVDWYRIDISNAIGQLTAQQVVNNCEAGATDLCAQITRDAATDRLVLVGAQFINVDKNVVSGIDFEADYTTNVSIFGGAESMGARVLTSFLNKNAECNAGAPCIDRAGQTGIQPSDGTAYALPDFKATGNITYNNGGFTAYLQGRYIGSGKMENALVEGTDIDSNKVGDAFYLDLRISQEIEMSGGGTLELYASATNLNDQDPPVTPYYSVFFGYSQQYNPSLFDVLGRRFTVGARFRY